ncbi:MAG: hypothetical protein AAB388_00860 [Patescibacteria group bacterium]
MKYIYLLVAGVFFISFPSVGQALSCIDPEGMVGYSVKEPNYLIVTATPKENREHVKKKADMEGLYDSGYTAQFLDINTAHKGTAPDGQWVYFERNDTWNYLCAGEPPQIGTENIYVINIPVSVFDLPTVVNVHQAGSDIAKKLLKALEDSEEEQEPAVYEVPKADWVQRLTDELKDMAFLIEVKLSEWKYWLGK